MPGDPRKMDSILLPLALSKGMHLHNSFGGEREKRNTARKQNWKGNFYRSLPTNCRSKKGKKEGKPLALEWSLESLGNHGSRKKKEFWRRKQGYLSLHAAMIHVTVGFT